MTTVNDSLEWTGLKGGLLLWKAMPLSKVRPSHRQRDGFVVRQEAQIGPPLLN